MTLEKTSIINNLFKEVVVFFHKYDSSFHFFTINHQESPRTLDVGGSILFKSVNREDVLTKVKKVVKDNYEMNTLGARLINTLIHQYFIKGGKLGDEEIKEITFQRELSF